MDLGAQNQKIIQIKSDMFNAGYVYELKCSIEQKKFTKRINCRLA